MPDGMLKERGTELEQAILKVVASGRYLKSNEVLQFELEFSQFFNMQHCNATASGTDALVLSLLAVGISAGDEVITVANTATATVAAIKQIGAIPVFVDVNKTTRCMDANLLINAITEKTRAIVPVHLFGQAADMPAIMAIADHAGISVIEDCAQAHGATINGKPVGSFGCTAAYSFYPTKNLPAMGDAGAVLTNNTDISRYIRMASQYGWDSEGESCFDGRNSRMDEIQAAILRINLRYLHKDNSKRREIAQQYEQSIKGSLLQTPLITDGHVMHLYVLECEDRKYFRKFMHERNIDTAVHYAKPLHLHRGLVSQKSPSLPITEMLAKKIVSLPMHPFMENIDIERVCTALREWVDLNEQKTNG